MNRTGLFIALALGARHRIAVRDFSRTRSEAGGAVLRCRDEIVSAEARRARRVRARCRDVDRVGLALPAIVALVVKLVRPDRPLLISGRAIVFLLVTMMLSAGVLTNLTFKSYWGRPRPVVVTQFNGAAGIRAVVGSARQLRAQLLVLLRRGRHRVLDLRARGADAAGVAAAGLCGGDPVRRRHQRAADGVRRALLHRRRRSRASSPSW